MVNNYLLSIKYAFRGWCASVNFFVNKYFLRVYRNGLWDKQKDM